MTVRQPQHNKETRMTWGERLHAQLAHIAKSLPPPRFPDPCEWDPENDTDAMTGSEHASAELIVGADGDWRLCASCAALPQFKRYVVRKPILHAGPQERPKP